MERKQVASPAQCRAARALLKWTQRHLAEQAGVARKTVADFEAGVRRLHLRTRADITTALQTAGVEFTWSEGIEGVRCARKFPVLAAIPVTAAVADAL
ncbi:MAG TPA: helix-turn-helix transcriptional regulator [Alphaproteobacteria bacterium]